jgi:hypothetical protein
MCRSWLLDPQEREGGMMQTIIAIQDEYIEQVMACRARHIRRVKRGAWRTASGKLQRLGYSHGQATALLRRAHDMVGVIQIALALEQRD